MIRTLRTERAFVALGAALVLLGCQPPPKKLVLPTSPVESGFAIDTDAFAFSNFGGATNGSTMTPALASRLFGAESICAASSEMDGCRPTPIAKEWIKKVNESMKGGRCEGFAVLSNLLFLGQLKPQDFGAENARELTLSNNEALGKEIAYWFSTQYVSSVVGKSTVTLSAKEAVSFFAEEFAKNRGEMYRIGMVRIDEAGRMAGGHAMVPTSVGPGIIEGTYVIRVYDNNHPDEDRQILIDAKSDRWEYQASSNPDKASSLYMGDPANKNRLFITSVSPRLGTHECSFCEGATSEGATVNQVFTMGGAEVAAINDDGQTAGIVEGRIVNQIEGAFITPSFTVDPWDDDAPVSMVLPSAAGSTKLSLAGRGGADKAQVTIFAAGSATGVEGLIPVGAADTLTLTEGGAGMKYAPSSGSAPQIFMARQTKLGTQTMVKLQIPAGLGVSGVSMAVNQDTGDVSLAARGMGDLQLDVSITRSTGDGDDEFVGVVEAPEGGSVDFEVESWAGEGAPIEATVDVDGDGTPDQTVEVVPTGPAGEAPASPINVVASPMGPDLVSVSWTDQSAGEESFEVERDAMGGGTFVALATLPPNASTYDDSAVRHSASYRYRVRAVNRYGASAWSNEADVTLPGCVAGRQDEDGDGQCQPDCTTAALACGSFGQCSTTTGTAACVCEAGYVGATCAQCDAGFQDTDGNGTCLPTCATAALSCDGHGTCSDVSGTASCVCEQGYAGTGTLACADIDECATANGGCDALASCTNTPGARTCGACPSGYDGTGETACVDIDECATNNGGCDSLSSCSNTPGGRTCGSCPAGYSGTGGSACIDIDECAVAHGGCDALASCTNTPGARTCGACPSGYTGSGETACVDVDECATAHGGCDALASCTNTPGARTCGACPSGYSGTGETSCADVDECAVSNGGCDSLASCTNTPGARTCGACPPGYTGTGETSCVDVDECAVAHGGCDALASCTNTPGARTCGACPSGYTGTGETACVDVDECATAHGGCDALSTCTNTPGARTCGACPSGYTGTGETSCVDVDECAVTNGGCDSLASCTNTPGARTCGACPSGYTGTGETSCVDVDECAVSNGGCDSLASCTNTPGARTCGACPPGYTGTGETSCVDVDECAVSNGGCDSLASCTNTPGARTCGSCPLGYTGTGDTTCVDVDDCLTTNGGCDPLSACTNTPGFRTCGACPSGYTGTGESICFDVDECAVSNGGCDALASCTNTPGARTCGACPTGYTGDGETSCVDVDECASNNGGCDALASCTNTPGDRACGNCPLGYTGSGDTTCVDVDECLMTNGGCDPLSACTNTPGFRTCGACPSGYSGTGEAICFNIDECTALTHDCHGDATCADTVGSFTCTCNAGFTGSGTACEPITGCHLNGGGCDVNATCTGTGPTTNTCSCNQGYVGTGQTCTLPPVAAVTFRQAARWVGLNAGTVSIDVVRSYFHEGDASIAYTLSGACQKSNQNGTVYFNQGQPWTTLDLTIDPTCVVGDTLVVSLELPSSNAAVPPVLGEFAVHTVNITAADPCTTEFPQLLVDGRDDLDIDGIPDRCDRTLAPAGKVSRFVAASSAVAGNDYGGNLGAANTLSASVNGPPATATHLFTHDWSPHWNDSGSWLTSQNELTQWFTVSFAGPVTVDEFSMINFSHTNRNLEWMRGVKDFRLYGSNTIATPPGLRASAEPSMVLLGSYTALSANDRSWAEGGQVKGLPQVFRVNSSTQYQYYHFEFTTSQRTDWTGHYPGDLTGLRRIEFARYVDDGCLVNNGGCDSNATCSDVQGEVGCTCSVGFYGDGQTCSVLADDPRSIGALDVWVAADVGLVMNGSTVASWHDLSGHGHHFQQPNPAQQPSVAPVAIGGKPALEFQAAQQQFMGLPGMLNAQTTICYVARISGPSVGRVLSSLTSNWLMGWWNGSGDMAHFEEWVYSQGVAPHGNQVVYCGVMTGTQSRFYRDGVLLGTNNNGRAPNGLCLGGFNGGSEFTDVQVAELLVYRSALSPAAVAEVNAYLLNKYPSCVDGVHNGAEVDIDCGGGCGTCADNKMCTTHGDCTNGVCDADSMTCGPPGVRTYDFDGVEHSLVLPAGRTINVKVWGAGGQNSGYTSLGGGAGGFTSGQLVGAGQLLKVSVGRGATDSTNAFGGGGRGGSCGPSGGGGGLSKVSLANGSLLFVAGGGGGAGPGQGAFGGGGCGLNGGGTGVAVGGLGGTLISGFAPFLGEDADSFGAAGGGGYFGGAKGSGPSCDVGGGGGGGSCFIAPSVIAPLQLAAASTTPSTDTASWVRGNAGQGGVAYYEAGSNGRVVISWKTGVSCSVNNGLCDVNATCTDSGQGTVSCACNSGYGGDGSRCVDITAPPVANLNLWVAADRGLVMNGSTVSGWLDQSGNGNDFVQGDQNRQPVVDPTGISGQPALQFSANLAQTLTMGTNLPAPVTVCYVARISGPSHQRVLSGLYNNWLLGWHGDHSDRAYFEGWVWFGSPSINATPVSYCTVIGTTSSTLSRNGVQLAEGFGGFQGPNGLSVVGSGGNSEFSDAQVAEILVYGAALSGAERAHVETYLTSKYGL